MLTEENDNILSASAAVEMEEEMGSAAAVAGCNEWCVESTVNAVEDATRPRIFVSDDEAVDILRGKNSGCCPNLSRHGYRSVKRLFDIVFSGAALIVLLIPGVVLCGAICIDSPGAGPIYTQRRVGRLRKDGSFRTFRMLKFRSMVPHAHDMVAQLQDKNEADGPLFKIKEDPRVDSRIIETNARRPLSALVFASAFLPKNTVVSAMFPQVKVQIIYPAEMVEKFFVQTGRKTTQFSQKLAKRIFALLKGLNNRVRIPSGAAGFIQPASA